MAKNKQNYMNNPNLPAVGAEFEYSASQINQLQKASKNLLYFAENFFFIIDPDNGRGKIKLHIPQKRVLRKMRDNRFFILLASRQIGKALALDTPIPTPTGWTTMGEIKDGDVLYDGDGNHTTVLKAWDIMHARPCYKIIFDNNDEIIADEDHLWLTQTNSDRLNEKKSLKRTTHDIFKTLRTCDGEINHFIVSRTKTVGIKDIIPVDSVPVRCITVDSPDSTFLCGQTSIMTCNTTMMTIYALWIACFNDDQRVLIVANKEETAIEIISRIRLAYECLPNWLKPGVKEYGKTSIILANGTRIGISTTTGTAARGQSVNCLILDELAFIETHLIEEFWKSVYPIISASKKSKIFIASTANGVGNLFHKLYTGAENNETNWSCDKILWNEIPGRDEKWKADTIASLGSLEAWQQEFECLFLDAGEGSLTEDLYNRLMQRVRPPKFIFDEGSYLMWDEPTSEGIYVASVDTAEGVGADYSVVQIFDYRDLTNIKQVATFCSNTISPYNFTEKVHEILQHWGRPLVCIERNNCGAQVVDNLSRQYAYENIISWGASTAGRAKGQLGVIAHTNTKHKGVTNMRYWVNELDSVEICDVNLVKELKNFTRYSNGTWAAKRGAGYHDDRVMSLIWNLIILEDEIVQRYFEVVNYDKNRKPLQIKQFDFGIKYFIQPDNRFNKDENYDSAYPIIIGNAENQSSEFDQLTEMGYKPL
jgi:hypothetical protein